MSFQTPITIREIVSDIISGRYYLPSIQREFVWEPLQIEMLFDSLLRGYPIGSFLFWYVEATQKNKFKFYKFLQNYHEQKQRHNEPAVLVGNAPITAILDGQQRLTSLVIALTGTYAEKAPYKWRSSEDAYPEKRLYLNLLRPADEEEVGKKFNFKFLEPNQAEKNDRVFWFEVSRVFSEINDTSKVMEYILSHDVLRNDPTKFSSKTLNELCDAVNKRPIVNFYLEKEQDLDRVLNVFIRANSGGTKLSYSDLLLSIATALWESIDARDSIHDLVDEINQIGDGFVFDKDFILKSCLVLADVGDVKFKVDNFNAVNMQKIERQWSAISKAIRLAVELVDQFGFNDKRLTSINSIIPIAYYLKKSEVDSKYLATASRRRDRENIRHWLTLVLLRGTFGSMADTIQAALRKVISDDKNDSFPHSAIYERLVGLNRPVRFSKEDVEELLNLEYGDRRTFLVLSLLYPHIDYRHQLHIDHIFPRSKLTKRVLIKSAKVGDDDAAETEERRDLIPNLQLMDGSENVEKRDEDFDTWVEKAYPKASNRKHFLEMNYIPTANPLDYRHFLVFFDARRARLQAKLEELLLEKG